VTFANLSTILLAGSKEPLRIYGEKSLSHLEASVHWICPLVQVYRHESVTPVYFHLQLA
jgi:hypothetical protein